MATGLSSAEAAVCTPPAAARAEPSSASDPKWKKPCPARGKGQAASGDARAKRESGKGSLPVPVDAKQGDGKRKGGRGKGHKGGKGNPDAAEKRQQLSEENLKMIRGLAPKHPELQPQVGFTAKQL